MGQRDDDIISPVLASGIQVRGLLRDQPGEGTCGFAEEALFFPPVKKKRERFGSSAVAYWVKNPALSQLWCQSQLWLGFSP